jgi:hypothetical protein
MRDQSLDRVNGRSMAAFATICERKLNMVSVLKSAGEFAGEFVDGSGMRRSLRIRQGAEQIIFRSRSSHSEQIAGVAGLTASLDFNRCDPKSSLNTPSERPVNPDDCRTL